MNDRTGTYYLNNTGHRWVCLTCGKKDRIEFIDSKGNKYSRVVDYYEAFGNFASVNFRFKRKRISSVSDTFKFQDETFTFIQRQS